MGETAELMATGALCQGCGVFIDSSPPPGHPRYCSACTSDLAERAPKPLPRRCTQLHPGGGRCMLEAGHEAPHKIDPAAHRCHAKGCTLKVPPERLMCKRHWFMVPRYLRDRIWATYQPGQCDTKDPSPEWLKAADAAIEYIDRFKEK